MSYTSYYPVVPVLYVESPVFVDDNQLIGYKWYQRCSVLGNLQEGGMRNDWDFVHTGATQLEVSEPHQVGPPANLITDYSPYSSHVISTPEIPFHMLQYQNINSSWYPSSFTCPDMPPIHVHSPTCQEIAYLNMSHIGTFTKLQVPTTSVTSLESYNVENITEAKLFDESPQRKIDFIVETRNENGPSNAINVTNEESLMETIEVGVSSNNLANTFDNSFMMDNLIVFQNCSSILDYIEEFIRVKSRAGFIFKCEFDDDLLSYCFIDGLKEEIREALELWVPQTLQESIYLAKFQESLLEESLLVENVVMKSDKGLEEFELRVETRVDKTNCVNEVFGKMCRVEKQIVVEEMPLKILKLEEGVEALVEVADKSFIIPVCVNDSQRQTTEDDKVMYAHVMMQIMKEPTSTANTCGWDMNFVDIVGEETMLIFDPGGDELKEQQPCVIHILREMIRNKEAKQDEVGMTASACGIASSRYNRAVIEVRELIKMVKSTTDVEGVSVEKDTGLKLANIVCGETVDYKKKREDGDDRGYRQDDKGRCVKEKDSEIGSSLKLVDKNGDTQRIENGEKNEVIKFRLCVYEEFSERPRVGMIYGIEYTLVAWDIWSGTAATVLLHKLQQFILFWVSLKAIGVAKDKHLEFRRTGYGVNHWPRSCSNLDESWKHISSGYFEWERFSEALDPVVAMYMSSINPNEAAFTSARSANVYLSLLGTGKYVCCFVIINELTIYIASALFDNQIPNHIGSTGIQEFDDMLPRYKAHCKVTSGTNHLFVVNVPAVYQEWMTTDPRYLSQAFVLKIKYNPEPYICMHPCKSAHIMYLLRGVTFVDSFELCRKLVLLYTHGDQLHANFAYEFVISILENASDWNRYDEFEEKYYSNDDNESEEKGRGANRKKKEDFR